MEKDLEFFQRFLFEAPGDDPPDVAAAQQDSSPPDLPDDPPPADTPDDGPPDLGDTGGDDFGGDAPPDLGEEDSFSDDMGFDNADGDGNQPVDLGLDEKVSAIMNRNLYQRYLALLNSISAQLNMFQNYSDMLYGLSPDTLSIVPYLKKLDENVRLYIKNYFLNTNFSGNLLFFNKCLNLLKLLSDSFDRSVKKGVKNTE